MVKTGLVLEGGAMRGLFTAGVLDVMMEQGITFDGAIGVSAGAVFGCNYKAGQIGRTLRYNKRFAKEWRYCSFRSLLLTGDLYGAEFCYSKVPYSLDVFDLKAFRENPMKFYVVSTDVETGEAVYTEIKDGAATDMLWFRASASMPLVSRPVEICGKEYLDGGISDSIPYEFMEREGYHRNVVVLTQPLIYRKSPMKGKKAISAALRKYPAIAKGMEERAEKYNHSVRELCKKEKKGEVFVIRPPKKLPIGKIEHDTEKMDIVYEMGRQAMLEKLEDMKAFLEKAEE